MRPAALNLWTFSTTRVYGAKPGQKTHKNAAASFYHHKLRTKQQSQDTVPALSTMLPWSAAEGKRAEKVKRCLFACYLLRMNVKAANGQQGELREADADASEVRMA